jgi:integrase/recombinase XerD
MSEMFFRKYTKSYCVQIGKRQFNLGRDAKAAKLKYAKLISQHRPPALDAPVAVLIDRFLEWCKVNRANRSHGFYKEILDSFKQSIGQRLTVFDLRAYHVSTWIDTRYPKASDNYKNNLLRGVQRCFNWAIKQGYLERSPVQHIEKPQQTPRETFIDTSQWRVLQKRLHDQDFRDLLTILWETGCRPIEARTVEDKHLHGNRAVFERLNSKGKRIQRTVYFNDKAMRIINRLRKKYKTGPLLRNSQGNPWTKDAIKCRFQRLELPFDVSAYDFRHGFATRAIESGKLSDLEIALLMGHRDTRMLATVYQHVDQKHLQKALRKLG